jgi:regulator of nucleoside diphosphate kinase
MRKNPQTITATDMVRLSNLLLALRRFAGRDHERILALEQVLADASVVESEALRDQVVCMHSLVTVEDLDSPGVGQRYQLMYPAEAQWTENRISVLSPLGTALLGRRVGELVEFLAPSGRRRIRVAQVETAADDIRAAA